MAFGLVGRINNCSFYFVLQLVVGDISSDFIQTMINFGHKICWLLNLGFCNSLFANWKIKLYYFLVLVKNFLHIEIEIKLSHNYF